MTLKDKPDIIQFDTLTKAQLNFLQYCRELGYGKVEVTIKDGQPVGGVEKERLLKFD